MLPEDRWSETRTDLKAAQPWSFIVCIVQGRLLQEAVRDMSLSHVVLPLGLAFKKAFSTAQTKVLVLGAVWKNLSRVCISDFYYPHVSLAPKNFG